MLRGEGRRDSDDCASMLYSAYFHPNNVNFTPEAGFVAFMGYVKCNRYLWLADLENKLS